MRPRLFAAENLALQSRDHGGAIASMRPRLFAAENGAVAPSVVNPTRGFNEAAAFRRGERVAASRSRAERDRFNEAAAFRRGERDVAITSQS